jgi:malonate transporter
VMIGIPLVALAYGEAGLVHLFTLVSVHALVLLTTSTLALEMALLREQRQAGVEALRPVALTLLLAVRNAVILPVPLPIIAGLLFAQTGWTLPPVIDRPLQVLGQAFGPLALLLVGVTLAATPIGRMWKGALAVAAVKVFLFPALVLAIGWALGLRGLAFTVMVLAAALPVGANVFIIAQRYGAAEDLATASVAMSTLLALVSLTLVMAAVAP